MIRVSASPRGETAKFGSKMACTTTMEELIIHALCVDPVVEDADELEKPQDLFEDYMEKKNAKRCAEAMDEQERRQKRWEQLPLSFSTVAKHNSKRFAFNFVAVSRWDGRILVP